MESKKKEVLENGMATKKAWVAPSIYSLENVNTEVGVSLLPANEGNHLGGTPIYSS